jgi:hypothetical protein
MNTSANSYPKAESLLSEKPNAELKAQLATAEGTPYAKRRIIKVSF